MKREIILAAASLLCGAGLCAQTMNLHMKDGEMLENVRIGAKNQFGLSVFDHTEEGSGNEVYRHVRFTDLTPATLKKIPFCDAKTVERIEASLNDRAALSLKKYKQQIKETEGRKDLTTPRALPGGVLMCKLLIISLDTDKDGTVGWLFSDGTDSIFYGQAYLDGLIVSKGHVLCTEAYLTEKTKVFNGKLYPVIRYLAVKPKRNTAGPEVGKNPAEQ